MLKWNTAIPKDEVWIKIGGDKGCGNFKQVFEIGNVQHPNAPHNTVVVALFPADDLMYNLKVALQDHCIQLRELQQRQWK